MTDTPTDLAIHARGLAKRFGPVQAVSRIDLDLAPGQALGLLGTNGAGKSTTLSLLMGLRAPDTGQALIFGHPAGSPAARRLSGATPQATDFPDQITPREILTYAAARYGTAPDISALIRDFGLNDLIDRRIAGFRADRCAASHWRWPSWASLGWSFWMNPHPASTVLLRIGFAYRPAPMSRRAALWC